MLAGERMTFELIPKHLQTAISMLLHIYNQVMSQVMSACVLWVVTTATRTMEKTTTMTVSEKSPIRASFFLQDIRTLHSIRTGMVMTDCISWN